MRLLTTVSLLGISIATMGSMGGCATLLQSVGVPAATVDAIQTAVDGACSVIPEAQSITSLLQADGIASSQANTAANVEKIVSQICGVVATNTSSKMKEALKTSSPSAPVYIGTVNGVAIYVHK